MTSSGQDSTRDKREPEILSYATPGRASNPTKRGLTILLCAIGIVALLIAILLPVHQGSPERANRVKCASNLRQIGQGITLYAADHAGQFPASIIQLVTDADINPEAFVCPSSDDTKATGPTTQATLAEMAKPQHMSYIYIGAGMTTAVKDDTVLAYEKLENHDKEGMNILYADGHVDWLPRKEADYVLSELRAGFNPPRSTSPTTSPASK